MYRPADFNLNIINIAGGRAEDIGVCAGGCFLCRSCAYRSFMREVVLSGCDCKGGVADFSGSPAGGARDCCPHWHPATLCVLFLFAPPTCISLSGLLPPFVSPLTSTNPVQKDGRAGLGCRGGFCLAVGAVAVEGGLVSMKWVVSAHLNWWPAPRLLTLPEVTAERFC